MRVAILGNSGSGKSTAARRLGLRTGAAVLDLDTVAWSPGDDPVPRPRHEAREDVLRFCAQRSWILEGCYADLVQASLHFRPHLLFLNPGVEQCLANCAARPWEPHKYASPEEQDRRLSMLLDWVRGHYSGTGPLSYEAHRACFDEYDGPKTELLRPPSEKDLDGILGGGAPGA